MSFTTMDSKEANVKSAYAYTGVIPRRSLDQTQHEPMGSPRKTAEKEEVSQRNPKDSDNEPPPVTRNPEPIETNLQSRNDLTESQREKGPNHGDGKNKKSKRKKHKIAKEKSQDGSGSSAVRDLPSRIYERHSKETNTKQEHSFCLGLLNFKEVSTDALIPSLYSTFAPDTKVDIIWCEWIYILGVQRPKLVISIAGDTERRDLKGILRRQFKSLIKGTWIIKAPWLCEHKEDGLGRVEDYILDENHTHLLLTSVDKCDEDLRTSLEKFISQQIVDPDDKESFRTIPVISLIVDGEISTMKKLWQSVENRIPVLVLQSSGGAADFIAHGYNITTNLQNEEKSFFCKTFDEEMKGLADRFFAWEAEDLPTKQELVDNCLKQLRKALQHRELLTVFDLNDDETEKIDEAILFALLKANRSDINTQLSLALAWNRSDIARNEILTASKMSNYPKLNLHGAMKTALKQNRPEFVELFLEYDLHKFFELDILWDLYQNCFEDTNNASAQLLHNLRNKITLKEIDGSPDSDRETIIKHIRCIEDVIKELFGNKVHKYDPVEKFFIWAILVNRMSLAKLFWRIGKDHIETALYASCLLKKLSEKAYDEDQLELSLAFTQHSSEFEKLASEILGICYMKNRNQSHQLLVRELTQFGDTSLFCVAEENTFMDFLGQTCCQTKLSAIWKGHMALSTSWTKIVASIFMPLLIFDITFVDEKDSSLTKRGNGKVAPAPHIETTDGQNGCCSKRGNGTFAKFVLFYTAPVTKFIIAMLANIVFLGLFSFFVLTDLHPIGENGAPSLVEIFIWTYTFTSVIEEICQVATKDHGSILYKIRSWFGSAWNKFDIVLYFFFLTSVILRFLLYGEDFIWARMLYSLTLGMYFFRFLQYFDADQNIGPKVTMISRMLTDLMFFLLILLVFILSFGVTYQANLYPNAPQQWSLLTDVLYHPYWQMYGELFLDYVEGNDPSEKAETCTKNETLWRSGERDRCPEKSTLVVLLMVVYMLLTNVLLLNLLIALFSDTVKKVHDNSEKEWRFHRFSLVYEYANKPILFPPLNLPIYMYWLLRWCFRPFCLICKNLSKDERKSSKEDTSFRKKQKKTEHEKLSQFEREAMVEYMDSQLSLENDKMDKKIQTTVKRFLKQEISQLGVELNHLSNFVRELKHA